jgi:hypothetical protein
MVIPAEPDSPESRAASELQHYLEKIGKSRLNIVNDNTISENGKKIYVGKITSEKVFEFIENQIYIIIRNGSLYLTGYSPEYPLYAVYTFLENYLGCRYDTPEVEKVPTVDPLRIYDHICQPNRPGIS